MNHDPTEMIELLLHTEVWTPQREGGGPIAVEGPGELPYLPVFTTRAEAASAVDDLGWALVDGTTALRAAVEQGWGLVHGVRTAISWGTAYGVLASATGAYPVWSHHRLDLSLAGLATAVSLPEPERAPPCLRRAIRNVLSNHLEVARAWLLLVTVVLDEDLSNLVIAVESDLPGAFDGQEVADDLHWATPPGNPLHVVEVREGSALDLERLALWPSLYPEPELH